MSQFPESALAPMLAKLELGDRFEEQDRAALLSLPHQIRTRGANAYILREGDRPLYSCVLLSGFAVRHKVAGNGARQILSLHMKGDLVDLQNTILGIADHNVETLTRVEVAYIPVSAIAALAASHPALGKAMWRETLVEASIFREWILNLGRRNARARAAHFLCEMALRLEMAGLGTRGAFELPLTQEQLGDVLGLTSVHVNRTLKAMRVAGLADCSRKSVAIRDWTGLTAMGDFDDTYLHLNGVNPVGVPVAA